MGPNRVFPFPHLKNETDSVSEKFLVSYLESETVDRVILKDAVFWDVTSRGCSKNRRFGGT
jgi:hypothetical protein